MLRARTRSAWLVVAIAALVAGAGPAQGMFHTLKTDHYDVATDVSPQFTTLVGRHMEAIYKAYVARLRGYRMRTDARFTVKVFSWRKDYYASVPPELMGSAGAFVSDLRLLAAFREGRTDEQVFRTLYHEGFHQFLFTCVTRNPPLWVNEGLAEYFFEATWNGTGFTTGQAPIERLHIVKTALRQQDHIPLAVLFAMETESWLHNLRREPTRSSLQYSEAWSVVHFLIHAQGGRHRAKLLKYLRLMSSGGGHGDAFQKSFGTQVGAFEKAWARYVMGLKPGADSVCRNNLDMLAHLALMVYGQPRKFTSLKGLHTRLTDSRNSWHIESSHGIRIESTDGKAVGRLFRCPRAKGGKRSGYLLVTDPGTGLPVLACLEHRGVVLLARYVPKPGSGYDVRTEQLVQATVPWELARALQSAQKKR